MKTSWVKGLEEDQKSEMESAFGASALIRERLKVILADKAVTAESSSLSKDGYDVSNWAYKQADAVGYKRCIKEIISLLEK